MNYLISMSNLAITYTKLKDELVTLNQVMRYSSDSSLGVAMLIDQYSKSLEVIKSYFRNYSISTSEKGILDIMKACDAKLSDHVDLLEFLEMYYQVSSKKEFFDLMKEFIAKSKSKLVITKNMIKIFYPTQSLDRVISRGVKLKTGDILLN